MLSAPRDTLLKFLHIGDLHLTEPGLPNHLDLERIVDDINAHVGRDVDFVVLPGDNADDGTAEQFALVGKAVRRLRSSYHILPGDHDFKPRSLDAFYSQLGVPSLPYAETVGGCLCLFLDIVSHGSGGPDFRIGETQFEWLRRQLSAATSGQQRAVVFMHAYPADLRDKAKEVATLIDDSPVVLVDMVHTHYNELANDGRTIYAAVRSTGQIEEGGVGYAFAAVDRGVVSWRFKPLDSGWPFVLITSPADRRLVIDPTSPHQIVTDQVEVRASTFGDTAIREVTCQIDDQLPRAMSAVQRGLFSLSFVAPIEDFTITVTAVGDDGTTDVDRIEVTRVAMPTRTPTGSDANAIDPWPDRHLLGTQLGPNRNGKKW